MSRRSTPRTPAKSRPEPPASAGSQAKDKAAKRTTAAGPRAKDGGPVRTTGPPKPRQSATAAAPAVRPPARSTVAARRAARGRTSGQRRQHEPGALDRLRRVPTAAWVCAVVAFLNAACWSVISPPFQVLDEPSHFAYVQHLAETGSLPTESGLVFPPAEETALEDLRYPAVREHPAVPTISSYAAQHRLEHDLALPNSRTGNGNAGVATSEPPLYYALETIPYGLESGGTVLDRLALMRLLSAVMGGFTALFAFLFLREALPGARWAWTVGGLGVALAPLFGEMSGAVNPDAMLFAVSAALFFCLARGFRRGITPRLAAATGAVLAVGVSTKLNFVGLVPGAVLGVLALCANEWRSSRRRAYRCLALALGIGASPIALYGIVNVFSGHPVGGAFAALVGFSREGGSLPGEIAYIWQFYLPRLSGMKSYFHDFPTTRVYWFDGFVGRYGWLDTTFPNWVYTAALIPAGLIAVLFARALFVYRGALHNRLSEILVYCAISLGVLLIVGADDYLHKIPGEYAEPRYLLPMLALWGAVLTLAARGAGRRWGPVAGVAIVSLVLAHDIFSQLLVISRYYR